MILRKRQEQQLKLRCFVLLVISVMMIITFVLESTVVHSFVVGNPRNLYAYSQRTMSGTSSALAKNEVRTVLSSELTATESTVNALLDGGGTSNPDAFIGCTTLQYENYDVVTVDLDNDRDYPIYIGTNFSNEEGTLFFGYGLDGF
jgi:pheromone shutdown protein TraB